MAKSLLMIKARKLREQGLSMRDITSSLSVSKNSVSRWTKDILLTKEQMESLRGSRLKGAELGRFNSALLKKQTRFKIVEDARNEGIRIISKLSIRELLVTGTALYWGEGGKKNRRIEFCNSDPKMIRFIISWLIKCFKVKRENLTCTVGINQAHVYRELIVKEYWSKMSNVPLDQFRKTSFKRVQSKKIYENVNEHYGTLSIVVRKSTQLYYKIMGLITGLSMAA